MKDSLVFYTEIYDLVEAANLKQTNKQTKVKRENSEKTRQDPL